MNNLNQRPARLNAVRHPVKRVPIVDYRVHYRINGQRAAWSVPARDRTTAILNMKELVPGCVITHVARDGEW